MIALSKKPLKKLNFNKIIAFILDHIAKLVIIMLLFTHCTGIFIWHCTCYNAKGDINNNTLLSQDRRRHWTHSGPLPLIFLFVFYLHGLIRENNHFDFFIRFYFFSFFCSFLFFVHFFKMQVERRAFNGFTHNPWLPRPEASQWNSSGNKTK